MRIIAAEVAIAPENHPEVELGMLPLDVGLPGPLANGSQVFFERRQAISRAITGRQARRDAAVQACMHGRGHTVTVRLTLHTSRGDLTIRQQVVLREEELPEQSGANLPREQYRALCRSVERTPMPEPPQPPAVSRRQDRAEPPPNQSTAALCFRDDDLLGGFHARLPHRPIAPSDHAVAMYPTAS